MGTVTTVDLRLSGYPGTLGQYTPIDDRVVTLRYGHPTNSACALLICRAADRRPAPNRLTRRRLPIATRRFRRFVPLDYASHRGRPCRRDPLDPPIELTVTRPRVGYPTALFADAANAEDRLLADARRFIADGAGDAPGIPDPDAETAEISVAVVGLRFDSANDGNGIPPVLTIYTTTREFPDDTDEPLVLALDWVDVADVTTLFAPATGSIPLPRAREVIITVRAVGRSDPGLDYFGLESARFGDPTSVQMFAAGVDETAFFVADDPARQLRCVLLRPQEKKLWRCSRVCARAGAGRRRTRARCTCSRKNSVSKHLGRRCGPNPVDASSSRARGISRTCCPRMDPR